MRATYLIPPGPSSLARCYTHKRHDAYVDEHMGDDEYNEALGSDCLRQIDCPFQQLPVRL
jgi:hypothetical protein